MTLKLRALEDLHKQFDAELAVLQHADAIPLFFVLAGVSGAGKSSVAGVMLDEHALSWFNPDTHARQLGRGNPKPAANTESPRGAACLLSPTTSPRSFATSPLNQR